MSEVGTRIVLQDGNVHVAREQDCEPILQQVTRLQQDGAVGSGEMRHAARFPFVLVEQYINDHGIDFAEFLRNPEHAKRMLQDPALSGFRVWQGKV